ncbi:MULTISPECIES: prepilin-type N-terminal cleavage/methylation domain-containing protein [unclassified Pseudoalteromonas]|uniref:type II secretion system protein n=1 Tax=unclassified Pseudoalteromonas TaxID=194690 RepID=UPI0027DFC41B|nr:prepilin-type N-terminal cleavage/methylation domain-containing protein [Pseudoalteromonas sp. 2CM28B]
MMSLFSKQKGFSLIELMVVMAIVATLMGLTGALLNKNVNQQQRLVEIEKTQHIFKMLAYKAYYQGYPIHVNTHDNALTIEINGVTKVINFKELHFQNISFLVSTRSTVFPKYFKIVVNGNEQEHEIIGMFKPYEQR